MGFRAYGDHSRNAIPFLFAVVAFSLSVGCGWISNAGADQNDPRLPGLFQALEATSDPQEGDRIGRRIAEIWNEHDNEGIVDIMQQGQSLMTQGQLELALGNFTAITKIEPAFAEAWNKRASVLYKMGELDAAARNIAETLVREPRHFLAIAGQGVIYLQKGDLEDALRAFDHALKINPHLSGTQKAAHEIRKRLSN
ncbi:MAG: tetratricopeptide repeat protein [Gammaproteobacteria bacterium]|nr:tetratricopeptide repeat protein [Gammaproteobacteria bacterium]